MSKPFKGTINVDIRDSVPDWPGFEPPKAQDGAPNVVCIVLGDVGFSAMNCYGARFGGHALYVKDNRLHYVNNFVGMFEQKVSATEDVPTGENLILSVSFDKDGEDPPGVATGVLFLYYGGRKVGEGRIKNQPGYFELAGEGLCVGRDSGAAVTDDYPGQQPWRFTGGTIKRVAIDVSGRPYVDMEREAQAMLARE